MKNTKRVPFSVSSYQYKGVEQWLNQQAGQGWELTSRALLTAKFLRTDRTDLRYCTDLISGNREEQLEYLALCKEAGWEQVERVGIMAIFASRPGTDPDPIQTDPELERANCRRAYRWAAVRNILPLVIAFAFYGSLILAMGASANAVANAMYVALVAGWPGNWLMAGIAAALPLLTVAAVWLAVDFIRAQVVDRRAGEVAALAPWTMWANCVANLLLWLGLLLMVAGLVLDAISGRGPVGGTVGSFAGVSIGLMIRRCTREPVVFPKGYRRETVAAVVSMIAAIAVCAAAINAEHTDTFFAQSFEGYAEHQAVLDSLPILQESYVGLEPERCHIFVRGNGPAGDHIVYMTDLNYQLADFSCARYDCRTGFLAEWTAQALTTEAGWPVIGMYYTENTLFSGADMEPINLNWADEAFYGEGSGPYDPDGDGHGLLSVLVVRKGDVVVRVSACADLDSAENLEAIRSALEF